MSKDISFDYNVPVFAGAPDAGNDEPVHRDAPAYEALAWPTTKEGILAAEELGFDAAWAPDHLMLGRDRAEYEAWTLLSTIAGFTDDINLGSLVLCNDYRNPALVAKMAATLDVISEGRLELGLGAGWHEPEYDAYDWELLRWRLRSEGVQPAIKHCESGWHGIANNVLLDDTTYHQPSNIEATFFALRRKYGEIVRARTWYSQFRELVLKCAARNIELALRGSNA